MRLSDRMLRDYRSQYWTVTQWFGLATLIGGGKLKAVATHRLRGFVMEVGLSFGLPRCLTKQAVKRPVVLRVISK